MCACFEIVRGNYTITIGQNDDDDILFVEFPSDIQEDCHSLSYKEVVSQERRFRFSNGGEMLDSNVKKDSQVKSSL